MTFQQNQRLLDLIENIALVAGTLIGLFILIIGYLARNIGLIAASLALLAPEKEEKFWVIEDKNGTKWLTSDSTYKHLLLFRHQYQANACVQKLNDGRVFGPLPLRQIQQAMRPEILRTADGWEAVRPLDNYNSLHFHPISFEKLLL